VQLCVEQLLILDRQLGLDSQQVRKEESEAFFIDHPQEMHDLREEVDES